MIVMQNRYDIIIVDLVGQSDQSVVSTKDYYFTTFSILVSAKQACYHYSDEKTTNKFAYKTSKKLIYSRFYFYCSCSKIIMAIETEMFRLLFLCHGKGVNLMELSMREKELLIMFGSERRLHSYLFSKEARTNRLLPLTTRLFVSEITVTFSTPFIVYFTAPEKILG